MHGMNNVKVIHVQQARIILKYKNIKMKLFKIYAANGYSIKHAGSDN